MTKGSIALSSVVSVLLSAGVSPAYAWVGGEPGEMLGRMTGGGSIMCGSIHVTHGFELHCGVNGTIPAPNNLEINYGGGNNFHLTTLQTSICTDAEGYSETPPNAGFDTMVATGTGTFNQQPGYTIAFKLTDKGEPGGGVDTMGFTIKTPAGAVVLSCNETVLDQSGNHQAHRVKGAP